MSRKQEPDSVSRRTFIKTLSVGVAGTTITGALPPISEADETPVAAGTQLLEFEVNGRRHRLHIEPRMTLAEVLRDRLDLTGTKVCCNQGTCGTCTVLLDDLAVYSCHMLALDAAGHRVTTIEGLMEGEELHPLQKAFVDRDGLQCGYCTPGQVMSARALLLENPDPTTNEIREAMTGNLCRCGAYPKIIESIEAAK
jgi:xanthine dehydrogenase YagT iron-sulfur-binding subunit